MYRHGDVIIRDAVKLPATAERLNSSVVAEGEVTGHAHRMVGGEVWADGNSRFIVAGDDATLTHEEHHTIDLPKSDEGFGYPVIIQREYDDEEEWRQVAD